MDKNTLYRKIPKTDLLLEQESFHALCARYGRAAVLDAVRAETEQIRTLIRAAGEPDALPEAVLDAASDLPQAVSDAVSALPETVEARLDALFTPGLRRVFNATGTILHTNLGRAPLGRMEALTEILSGYSTLEYSPEEGRRGDRCTHIARLLRRLTGVEDAFAVNNNAAAVLLALTVLARDGEVIVSRGELVEIGGKFRIPDVCQQSGARLREVGTTNRTRLSDYEQAITDSTKAILKVHTSNYAVVGFTESVPAAALADLAHSRGLWAVQDLGSGTLMDMEMFGLPHEPTVREAVAAGMDVVCFSGDKLLGGPQAGILAGRADCIRRMRQHPLARALRIDKFTAAALEAVLRAYLDPDRAAERIPVLRMLGESGTDVERRAVKLAALLNAHGLEAGGTESAGTDGGKSGLDAEIDVVPTRSVVGGGAMPTADLPSFAVRIRPRSLSAAALERNFRARPVPIAARTAEGAVLLDCRTLADEDLPLLAEEVRDSLHL